jgi:fructose-specific phosphotransferase system IIC component
MTIETGTVEKPKREMLTRGKGFLGVLAVLVLITAVCAWISLGIGVYLEVERGTRLILAIIAAVATEVLFWTVAALLGVSVVEARKRIWRRITGRGSVPPA